MDSEDEAIADIAYKLKTMIAKEEENPGRAPKQSAAALRVLHELESFIDDLVEGRKKG